MRNDGGESESEDEAKEDEPTEHLTWADTVDELPLAMDVAQHVEVSTTPPGLGDGTIINTG